MNKQTTKIKETLRIRRTYNLLLDAFASLLEEKTFEEIRVTDICDRAMVHRATFYKHFEDKYHLMSFAITELKKELREKICMDPTFNHPKQYYMGLLKQLLEYLSANKKLALLVIVKSQNTEFLALIHQLILSEILCVLEYIEDQEVPQTVPRQIVAEFHAGALIALVRWWLKNNMPISEEELLKYIEKMINDD